MLFGELPVLARRLPWNRSEEYTDGALWVSWHDPLWEQATKIVVN